LKPQDESVEVDNIDTEESEGIGVHMGNIVYSSESIESDIGDSDTYMINNYFNSIKKENVYIETSTWLSENVWILDTAAERSVACNKNFFYSIQPALQPIFIGGVNSTDSDLLLSMEGKTSFGFNSYYSDSVPGNILSYAQCVDNCFSVRYDWCNDIFMIEPSQNGTVYIFNRDKSLSNLYTCDMNVMNSADQSHKDKYNWVTSTGP
jgi:hypothetical protein